MVTSSRPIISHRIFYRARCNGRSVATIAGNRTNLRWKSCWMSNITGANGARCGMDLPCRGGCVMSEIIDRLEEWKKNPTLTVSQIQFLTGLSRTRVLDLVEEGVFRRNRENEILLQTVCQWYAKRALKLSGASKCQCK